MRTATLFILLLLLILPAAASAQVLPSSYTPLSPCRFFEAPVPGGSTAFTLSRGECNIPQTANALALSIGTDSGRAGLIKVWDAGVEPLVGMSYARGEDSNFSVVRLCYPVEECAGEDLAIKVSTSAFVALDVVGYFEPLP